MNQEVKEKWINALRSGNYSQGKHWLCSVTKEGTKSFCCLGVLTDLYIKENPGEDWEIGSPIASYKGEDQYLVEDVIEWAGFVECSDPEVNFGAGVTTLSQLNDDCQCDFLTIANVIERDL